MPAPILVKAKLLPEITPPTLKPPAPPMELLAAIATVPLTVAALLLSLLIKAPPKLMPVPLMVSALKRVLPYRSNNAPDATVTAPTPTAPLLMLEVDPVELAPIRTVPPETVLPPEYVLAPDKTTTPLLVLSPRVNAPVPAPEIRPSNVAVLVVAAAILLAPELKIMAFEMVLVAVFINVAPAKVTSPVDKWVPLLPPDPTDKTMPVTVAPPVKVLAPDNTRVPLLVASPNLKVPVPEPEITLLKVTVLPVPASISFVPALNVIVLLMVTLVVGSTNKIPPPRVTAPVDRWLPLAPPEATYNTPALMVVPDV